jgi:hypothetical protein
MVCTVDGVERFSQSYNKNIVWTNVVINLMGTSVHVVRWSYVKGVTPLTSGADAVWIDNVTWTCQQCTLTVQGGSGSGIYNVGETATIIATNVTPFQGFERWSGDVANVADVNSMTTTVYMASDTVVSANYKLKYSLTVTDGNGSGSYFGGQTINVAANEPPGMVFVAWSGDTEYLADPESVTTTFLMPERDVAITAIFTVEPYHVSVLNGWDAGSLPNAAHEGYGEPQGSYPFGAAVRIVANPAPLWKTFNGWTASPAVTIDDTNADVTWFVMPSSSVTLTACYRDQTVQEKLAGALTIRGQPLVITEVSSTNGIVALSSGGMRYNDPIVKFGGPSVSSGQNVYLSTTNFDGSGVLLFWWQGDAETDADGIAMEVDGAPISSIYSEKATNIVDNTVWHLSAFNVNEAETITFRYTHKASYLLDDSYVLMDRLTWIPKSVVDALDTRHIPVINQEFDPCFNGHMKAANGLHDFSGEDGGIKWDATESAIKIGNFGYVTNNQMAQVGFVFNSYNVKPAGGIYTWEWKTESESNFDRLELLLDLIPTNWISGKDTGWITNTFVLMKEYVRPAQSPITDASVTWPVFGFRYKKDYDLSFLADAGWVRNATWCPSYNLSITNGMTTMLVFSNTKLGENSEVLTEASKGVIPKGTQVSIIADPAPSGMVFAAWSGELGGVIAPGLPMQTFSMPEQNLSLKANYTTLADPMAGSPQINHFTINDTLINPNPTGLFIAMAPTTKCIEMAFACASVGNYEVEWSPSLSGPTCIWRVIPFASVEVTGNTPEGFMIWKIQATTPSDSQQGFFRLNRKK